MAQKIVRTSNAALTMVLAAVAATFSLLAFWTPLMQDDLVFMAQSADLSADPPCFSWDAWHGHVGLMYAENNGRLANLLAPLGAWLLPQWSRAVLTGLCAAWIFFMAGRMAFGRGGAWKWVLVMWAVSLFAWPWRDRLMFWDYALNYLFASAFLLPFIYLFCKMKLPATWVAVGALCGFFGAWMHDGSALCMVATVGCIALTHRFRLSGGEWIMVGSLLLGTVAVLASPGEWQRAAGEVGSGALSRNIWISLRIEPLAWLIGAVAVASFTIPSERCRNVLRRLYREPLLLSCSLMAFFSLIMSVSLDPSGRYGWQAGVFAAVALFGLWHRAEIKVPRVFGCVAVIASGIVVAVVMASAAGFQHRLWNENEAVLAESEVSETGTVFRDLLSVTDEPLAALRLPTTGIWESSFQMACANAMRSPRGKMVAVVPECFRDFSLDSLRMLPGNAGVGVYKGYLVGTDTITPFDAPGFLSGAQRAAVRELVLTDSAGSSQVSTFWLYKFRVPRSSGRAAVFYGPVNGEVSAASMPPTAF